YRQQRSWEEIRQFISYMQGNLSLVLFLVIAIALLITPWITTVFAPGYINDPLRFKLTTDMLRITFPYLMLISLTAFYSSVLNSYGLFAIPSFTPVLLNLIMIIAGIWIAPHFAQPVIVLAWSVFIAGVTQFLFQCPLLYAKKLLVWPRIAWRDQG